MYLEKNVELSPQYRHIMMQLRPNLKSNCFCASHLDYLMVSMKESIANADWEKAFDDRKNQCNSRKWHFGHTASYCGH